jgi:hypothetical protein
MNHRLLACACGLALAACGGSDKAAGNAAAAAAFTYGSPSAATPTQAGALEISVTSASAFAAAPSASQGLLVSDPAAVTEALLGASGFGVGGASPAPSLRALRAPDSRSRALVGSDFDNPACASPTATGVTLTACTITVDMTSGSDTIHMVVTASGWVSYAAATGALGWDLGIGETMTMSGTTPMTVSGSVHLAGSLAVTATTIRGHMESELLVTASAGGQTERAGVDECVVVDVTYADAVTCSTRVTGGTVEAKRVWTVRPQGATSIDFPDAAAEVTWTACGEATIQYGTR